MVTFFVALTLKVVTVNWALVLPAGAVTLSGTVATAVLLLVSVTVVFIRGAPSRVTVPWLLVPPTIGLGLKLILADQLHHRLTCRRIGIDRHLAGGTLSPNTGLGLKVAGIVKGQTIERVGMLS